MGLLPDPWLQTGILCAEVHRAMTGKWVAPEKWIPGRRASRQQERGGRELETIWRARYRG